MNSYERYMGMVKGEKVDIVPRVPILMHFAARYAGVTYGDFARNCETLVAANIKLVEDFGFEQLDITHHPLEHSQNLDELVDPDPRTSERMSNAIRAIQLYKEFGYRQYSITGWVEGPAAEAADIRGVMNFLMDLMTEEGFACELMDRCVDNAIRFALAQLSEGADTIGIGDSIASQLSPELYENHVFPREKQLVDAIHAGALDDCPATVDRNFGLDVPTVCPDVPPDALVPRNTWKDQEAYDRTAQKLCELFRKNFVKYEVAASREIRDAGPQG